MMKELREITGELHPLHFEVELTNYQRWRKSRKQLKKSNLFWDNKGNIKLMRVWKRVVSCLFHIYFSDQSVLILTF